MKTEICAVVLNGVSLFTIPGINVGSLASAPVSGWSAGAPPTPSTASDGVAVDVQVGLTSLQ